MIILKVGIPSLLGLFHLGLTQTTGPLPTGWKEIKTIWLDAKLCYDSEVEPLQQNGTFTITSYPWKPNFEGRLVSLTGHLHDARAFPSLTTGIRADAS